MTARGVRRIGYGVAGGYLLLNARPLSYLLFLFRLDKYRRECPEMFDGAAASAAVNKAILSTRLSEATQTYQAQLELSRRAYEIELPEDQLVLMDEDLAKAKAALEVAWLEAK